MAQKTIMAHMKQRRDTLANWASINPVLLDGELGIVTDDPNLYKVGNGSTAWNDLPFRGFDGTLVHHTGTSATAVMSQKAVTDALSTKAGLAGNYPELTAGFANNLVGRGEAMDAVINFRASGGKSIEDGAARVKVLKGNSVVWNQLASPLSNVSKYYPTNAKNLVYEDGVLSCEVSSLDSSETYLDSYVVCHANHKYMASLDVYSYTTGSGLYLYVGEKLNAFAKLVSKANAWEQCLIFFECPSYNARSRFRPYLGAKSKITELGVVKFRNAQFIDLTQMFGEGNEPTTIEEFYNRIPQNVDLYAYNEGEIVSTNAEGIKSVGFNAWDGVMYEGFVDDADGNIGSIGKNTGFIRILPNTDYYIKTSANVGQWGAWYDEQKKYISGFTGYNKVHKSPSNAAFMCCTCMYTGVDNADDFCINLAHSGYRNGEYQPYMQFIRDIDSRIREAFPNGMKSAGNASDKVYNKNGKGIIEKRIGKVKINDLTWSLYNIGTYGIKCFTATRPTNTFAYINASTYHGILSETFINKTWNEVYDAASESAVGLSISATKNEFRIVAPNCNDVETFLASYGESYIIYELAEPEILEFDEPFNLDYEVWDFGTEQMLSTEPSAPIKASIVYGFNAVDSIRTAQLEIDALKTQLAQMQTLMASLAAQPAALAE